MENLSAACRKAGPCGSLPPVPNHAQDTGTFPPFLNGPFFFPSSLSFTVLPFSKKRAALCRETPKRRVCYTFVCRKEKRPVLCRKQTGKKESGQRQNNGLKTEPQTQRQQADPETEHPAQRQNTSPKTKHPAQKQNASPKTKHPAQRQNANPKIELQTRRNTGMVSRGAGQIIVVPPS